MFRKASWVPEVAARPIRVPRGHFLARGITRQVSRLGTEWSLLAGLHPPRQEMADVEEGIADRAGVPVDDRRQPRRRIARHHHVERAVVAVEDGGRAGLGAIPLEPRADEQPWVIDMNSLALALDEAARRLET